MKRLFVIIGCLVMADVIWAQWKLTTVDANLDSVFQRYTSIAVDGNGYPGISYCSKDSLKYAHWNGSSWDLETIVGISGTYNALAYGTGNIPYIIFKTKTGGNLHCAVKTSKGWTTEVVDTNNANSSPKIVGFGYPSMTTGLDGYPRLAYEVYWTYGSGGFDYGADLRYARYTADSGWKVETAWNPPPHGDGSYGGEYAGIAVDRLGNIHFSHQLTVVAYSSTLCYTVNSGAYQTTEGGIDGTWTSNTASGYYSSIAVDSLNNPYISYILSEGSFYYLRCVIPPDSEPKEVGQVKKATTSIGIDNTTNYPCIAYGMSDGTLGYAVWGGSSWNKETVDGNPKTGSGISLCIRNGVPHISYADETNRDLKYATWDVSSEESSEFKVESSELKITPNPAFSKFYIGVDGNGKEFKVKLFDAGGRLIKILHNGNERVWESEEILNESGIYFVTLTGLPDNRITSKKIIILGNNP